MLNYFSKSKKEGIFVYKLIASDLDGTLLATDRTLSERNKAAIKKFKDLGVIFSVSSGRALYEIPPFVLENPDIRYIAYSNGSAVFDKEISRDIISFRISNEYACRVLDVLSKYSVLISAHVGGHAYFDKNRTSIEEFRHYKVNDYYREVLLNETEMTDDMEGVIRRAPGMESFVLFFSDDREMETCRKELSALPGISITSSVAHNIEICSDKAQKGNALTALADFLGIKTDEIIAVGDNTNDTSMFRGVGLALCTAGATPDAKALADEVICENDEHVAEYILNRYFN